MNNLPVKLNAAYYSLTSAAVDPKEFKVQNIGFCSERGIAISHVAQVN